MGKKVTVLLQLVTMVLVLPMMVVLPEMRMKMSLLLLHQRKMELQFVLVGRDQFCSQVGKQTQMRTTMLLVLLVLLQLVPVLLYQRKTDSQLALVVQMV